MNPGYRLLAGALSGAGATVGLTLLRATLKRADLVGDTAPAQVLMRAEELGLLDDYSEQRDFLLTLAAHYAYGTAAGTAFGFLRKESGTLSQSVATGAALGLLCWAGGWAVWLPLSGVHSAPWNQYTPKVLLPAVDHAFYGAMWGFLYRIMCEEEGDQTSDQAND